eukprot:3620476-Rhodomonas_salina.2
MDHESFWKLQVVSPRKGAFVRDFRPRRRLYLLFKHLGMHPDDVDLLRQCHAGAWVTVGTPCGETARVQVTRGSPQGDSLSPSLFVFFLNLRLHHLGTAGVGITHACGVLQNSTCFADDLALLATSIRDMNKLLAKVSEFAAWAGMELCVHKCEVAAYDFGTQTELNTHKIQYNGQRLAHLSADAEVQYLWLCLTITGDTSVEVSYILTGMKAAATKFKGHPDSYSQGFNLIPTALHPVFTYSVGVMSWTMAAMQALQTMWGLMGERACDT